MTKKANQYDENIKKNIVSLHQNGKTITELTKEYGISHSAISRWVKLYSEVKIDDETVLTAKQIRELQKRNAQLEEENLILKKRLPYSRHTPGKNERCSYTAQRARNYHIMPCTQGKPQQLLQAF